MGCTCGYQTENRGFPFEEHQEKEMNHDTSKHTLNEDMMRISSMSRISSQRSILLNNIKKTKEQKEPMKIGTILNQML